MAWNSGCDKTFIDERTSTGTAGDYGDKMIEDKIIFGFGFLNSFIILSAFILSLPHFERPRRGERPPDKMFVAMQLRALRIKEWFCF
jgi:hypothetical protein